MMNTKLGVAATNGVRTTAMNRIEANRISIKAKTNEGVDAIGSGDAVACYTTALLIRETTD